MKTAKIILAIAVLGFLGNSVQAQTYTDLYYTVGIPMGETADKIDGDASWRSFGFEW